MSYVLVNAQGEVVQEYYGNVAPVAQDGLTVVEVTTRIDYRTKFYRNGIWVDRVAQPTEYSIWQNGRWVSDTVGFWKVVRGQRNRLLLSTDWRVLPDVAGNKAAWITYRQALRDIPQNFPSAISMAGITWPVAPV